VRFPDFFTIGAAKSGTSTLHAYLSRHPGLWMSSTKEPCFFDPLQPPDRRDLGRYLALFEGAGESQLCAESSVNYTMWPKVADVPKSISQANPKARFIYLLREPVRRCYSHFIHRHEREVFRGKPYTMSFEDYLEYDPVITYTSDYASQIRRYLDYFPKESLLLLPFEVFVKEPARVLRLVHEFLGVEDRSEVDTLEPLHSNSTDVVKGHMLHSMTVAPLRRIPGLHAAYTLMPERLRAASISVLESSPLGRRTRRRFTPPPMLPETRKRLKARYEASAAYLTSEFGFDVSHWAQ